MRITRSCWLWHLILIFGGTWALVIGLRFLAMSPVDDTDWFLANVFAQDAGIMLYVLRPLDVWLDWLPLAAFGALTVTLSCVSLWSIRHEPDYEKMWRTLKAESGYSVWVGHVQSAEPVTLRILMERQEEFGGEDG
jgi:hypothetical protein